MSTLTNRDSWKHKISNHHQLGGIETSVIDNGSGKGNRIAWINTGTGLRYKVVIDRGMDIADAFFNAHAISWLSHNGFTAPQPLSDRGIEWLRTFGGGLLTTCGLTHAGGPEQDIYGERGLHDQVSNIPAELESVIQPDPVAGKMDMSISGIIRQSRPFGPSLELRRTISSTIGQPVLRIHDEVVNRGNTPAPHMLLYHFNFGWPFADEGTDIIWKGDWQPRHPGAGNLIFRPGGGFRKCPPPLEQHCGFGEEVGIIDIAADPGGNCCTGLRNEEIGLAVILRFSKKQLPWLTNWQHWGPGEYVTGLEPGTHPPIGQARAREENVLIHLQPGERRVYDVEVRILHEENAIREFVDRYNQ